MPIQDGMKAWRILAPGTGLVLTQMDELTPGPGELVVRITASGVCGSDLHILDGKLERVKYPITLGHEAAGRVDDVGEGVQLLKKGDSVLIYPTRGCGSCKYCVLGSENLCDSAKSLGFELDGTYAEYVLVKSERYLCRLRRVSEPEAAPLACAGVTVYSAVKNHVKALPGDTVVVIGAGGLGHLAVQVVRLLTAAHVVAVDTAEKKLKSAKNLGAEDALTPTQAKKLAKSKPEVAAVIDTVGSNGTLSLGYSLLGTKGSLVVLGAAGGVLRYSGPDPKDRVVAGPILGSITDLRETLELVELGLVRVVHQDYPLEMVNEVLKMVRGGLVTGRAVLLP